MSGRSSSSNSSDGAAHRDDRCRRGFRVAELVMEAKGGFFGLLCPCLLGDGTIITVRVHGLTRSLILGTVLLGEFAQLVTEVRSMVLRPVIQSVQEVLT